MNAKMKRTLWCWIALAPLVVVVLFPFAVMLFTALKPAQEVFVYPARWLPVDWHWQNFVVMWKAANFGVALRNSVVISLLSTLLALAVSLPAAYALARFPFRGRGVYQQFLLVTQMLSPILLVVGLFRLAAMIPYGDGNLVDSKIGVIVSYAAFNIAVCRVDAVVVFPDGAARPRRIRVARRMQPHACRLQGVPAARGAGDRRHGDFHVHQCVE